MDSFPLDRVSFLQILQIFQKCNDVSFIRTIRTCHRLYEMANKMGKKLKIRTTAYLPVFVYFDSSKRQIMFDVPYGELKKEGNFVERIEDSLRDRLEAKRRPLDQRNREDRIYWYYMTHNRWHWEEFLHNHPSSQLYLHRSDRTRAVYQRLTVEQLGQIVHFFKFETIAINPNNYMDKETPKKETRHPKSFLAAEEILKLLSFVQANTLTLNRSDAPNICQQTLLAAQKALKLKQLMFVYPISSKNIMMNADGDLSQLNFDWHKLEGLEAQCSWEDLETNYKDLITKWEAGQTKLKYLKLAVSEADDDATIHFPSSGILLEYWCRSLGTFHYLHSICNNRWAITLFCREFKVFYFYDISYCEGCDCQTEFCFKKLMEVLAKRIDWRDAID